MSHLVTGSIEDRVAASGKVSGYSADITILIADDHPVVRFGIAGLLNSTPGMQVVGEAESCAELCGMLATIRPDVVLLDLELGDVCGADALALLRKRNPSPKIVIFTAHSDQSHVLNAVKIGVEGYVVKGSSNEVLCDAIRAVARGDSYLDATVTPKVIDQLSHRDEYREQLTNREQVVLRHLSAGSRNKDIARELDITERTVKYHISSILSKLGAQNRTHAVRIAVSKGMVNLTM